MASPAEHAGDSSPPLHQSESPCRVPRHHPQSAATHHLGSAQSLTAEEEEEGGEKEEEAEEETAGTEAGCSEDGAEALPCAQALEFQRGYGSRLALSLGNLDIPQLMAERELHQGEMGMSPSIKSEPAGFGGVLGNSLIVNNLQACGNISSPKIVPAGDPGILTMMQNLAHWSEKARQEQQELAQHAQQQHLAQQQQLAQHDQQQQELAQHAQQHELAQHAQQHQGQELLRLHPSFHHNGLDSQPCSPSVSPTAGMGSQAAFRLPSGSFRIPSPRAVAGHGPSITSGAVLDNDSFPSGGSAVPGNSRFPLDHAFKESFACQYVCILWA